VFVLSGYDAFLGFLLISAAVPVLALVTNKLVAPKSRTGERDLTYESGMEPIGGAWIQFNIRYYMFALVFVIFDVEPSTGWACWPSSRPWCSFRSSWWPWPTPGARAPSSGADPEL
jgi:NADH:ubiquinone oxidoreductase subunit 3 (subunit A)